MLCILDVLQGSKYTSALSRLLKKLRRTCSQNFAKFNGKQTSNTVQVVERLLVFTTIFSLLTGHKEQTKPFSRDFFSAAHPHMSLEIEHCNGKTILQLQRNL